MKIAQVASWFYPDSIGGVEVYVVELSKQLQLAGQEVFIAAPHVQSKEERNYDYQGLPVYRYPVPLAPSRKECQGLVSARGTQYFYKWLDKVRPDVVHFHTLSLGLGVREIKIAKLTGAKIVFTSHIGAVANLCLRGSLMRMGKVLCDGLAESRKCAACLLEQRHLPKTLARLLSRVPLSVGKVMRPLPFGIGTALGMNYLTWLNQNNCRQLAALVDRFVVITQAAYNMALANGFNCKSLYINRLGVAQNKIAKKPSPQEAPAKSPVKIGYLGRFEEIKGIYDLAKAVSSLNNEVSFSLEFRGPLISDAEKTSIERIKAIIGNDPRVVFTPLVSHEEAFNVLRGYDVLCCPSLCFEGGPTAALEAFAVGTPVIGTRIGGLAEIVADKVSGRLVEPGDWRALARVIKEITDNPSATIDYWRKHIPPVRTMDEVTGEYLKIYES